LTKPDPTKSLATPERSDWFAGLDPTELALRTETSLSMWINALRLHQWIKNLLIFVPLILERRFDLVDCRNTVAGFIIFGLVASATYLINDLKDLESDRDHRTKRLRPLASGRIPVKTAIALAAILLTGGLASAFWLVPDFGFTLLAYVAITFAYSFKLKSEPLFDVFTIGLLFTLRLLAGMILLDDPISLWLSGFAFMFFMSLAMAKRHSELTASIHATGTTPKGRGYEPEDTGLTRAFGIGSALIAFLIMVLYFQFRAMATGLYDNIEILYILPLAQFAWTLRIWLKAHRGLLQDDPIIFALKDRISWCFALFIAAAWAIAAK
jgi:4-hydroxybenzoate polyprenyltransferase